MAYKVLHLSDISLPLLTAKLSSLWLPFRSTNIPHLFPSGYVEKGMKLDRECRMGRTLYLMVGVHRKGLNGPLLEWGAEPCSTHHGEEVVIAFDLGGHLGELLVKCI